MDSLFLDLRDIPVDGIGFVKERHPFNFDSVFELGGALCICANERNGNPTDISQDIGRKDGSAVGRPDHICADIVYFRAGYGSTRWVIFVAPFPPYIFLNSSGTPLSNSWLPGVATILQEASDESDPILQYWFA